MPLLLLYERKSCTFFPFVFMAIMPLIFKLEVVMNPKLKRIGRRLQTQGWSAYFIASMQVYFQHPDYPGCWILLDSNFGCLARLSEVSIFK